jgi:hypothetical protein
MSYLSPDYINLDFSTLKAKLQEQLEQSQMFNNYNYAGSNITILIELIAYLSDLTTFYLNKIAQNVFIDSATIYENVSRLAQLVGYYPRGYRSSEGTIRLILYKDDIESGSTITIPAWSKCWTNPPTEEDAYISGTSTINFLNPVEIILEYPTDFTFNENGYYEYDGIFVKQGTVKTYSYSGSDLVDNQIYLPDINFDHDQNLDDEYPSIEIQVNNEVWSRVSDFYESVSGLPDNDKVYVLKFNKYKNYIVEFSDIRNVPASSDKIDLILIESEGANGNIGSNWISQAGSDFVTVTTPGDITYNLATGDFAVLNDSPMIGGNDPDSIDAIKNASKNLALAQYRCVTKSDYKTYLNEHELVVVSSVWGEQEQNFSTNGNTGTYNKTYVSVVPELPWADKINYYTDENGINVVTGYDSDFINLLSAYLEPRKMLCAYEEYVVPDFIYFKFVMSMRLKSNYRFIEVKKDVKDKIDYYFEFENRDFGEKISFNDLASFILDTSKVSSTNNFAKVTGILNLNIRNIEIYEKISKTWINPYPASGDIYPKYIAYDDTTYWEENILKVIQLGPDQFPVISLDTCIFLEEQY